MRREQYPYLQTHRIKTYPICQVRAGMQIGRAVTSPDGESVLAEGVTLTQGILEALTMWQIDCIEILEPIPVGEQIRTGIKPPKEIQTADDFTQIYDETITIMNRSFSLMRYFKQVPVQELKDLARTNLFPLIRNTGIVNLLFNMQRVDDYTFHHSVNVAAVAGLIGKWLKLPEGQQNELIQAGLLHDIGKSQIPLEILNKPGKLTEQEFREMQRHSEYGYAMIKDSEEVSTAVKQAVWQHHERMDGTGYPLGTGGEKIGLFGRIIAVADLYDALTSDRVYRRRMTPFEAMDLLMQERFNKVDTHICTVFLDQMRNFFIGNQVKLTDGREAEIVFMPPEATRPLVKTQDGAFIDLSRRRELDIVELLVFAS
ncbi:HD-GYP domain-containing protein [Acetonema longum DSM 6540]|uniref:HD-GYP domain-containing protein n=1 Tax=Acetonema longum DSM 6540 TaxID=1009370 RepID=F7NI91_9FIRM|nr:HD-GYP domain-containing protein [Acetonema longum DSM 6540]